MPSVNEVGDAKEKKKKRRARNSAIILMCDTPV